MHTVRVIPCLDVNNNRVVKGVNFVNLRDAGIPDNGYVDHAWDAKPFIDDILNDETKFINFLFDPRSFIITGNDNEDYYSESPDTGDADAWEYCKGN